MPIDPRELARFRHHKEGPITTDRPCKKCGYNLIGLRGSGVCPECGQPILSGGGASRLNDTLADAPLPYLRKLMVGLSLMTLGAVTGGIVLYLVPASLFKLLCMTAAGVMWWLGVYIVTAERMTGPNAIKDAMLDSARLRLVNRVLQSAWIFIGIGWLGLMQQPATAAGVIFVIGAALFPVAGLVGFVPLAMTLSSLADWAGHSSLGDRFRATAWVIVVLGVFVTLGVVAYMLSGNVAAVVQLVLVASVLLFMIVKLVFLVWLMQLLFTLEWSIHNAQQSHARDQRRRERLEHGEPDRRCPECDYSLRGLPPLSRCPECGWLDPELRRSHLAALAVRRPRRER